MTLTAEGSGSSTDRARFTLCSAGATAAVGRCWARSMASKLVAVSVVGDDFARRWRAIMFSVVRRMRRFRRRMHSAMSGLILDEGARSAERPQRVRQFASPEPSWPLDSYVDIVLANQAAHVASVSMRTPGSLPREIRSTSTNAALHSQRWVGRLERSMLPDAYLSVAEARVPARRKDPPTMPAEVVAPAGPAVSCPQVLGKTFGKTGRSTKGRWGLESVDRHTVRATLPSSGTRGPRSGPPRE